jgi:hypothetical protein
MSRIQFVLAVLTFVLVLTILTVVAVNTRLLSTTPTAAPKEHPFGIEMHVDPPPTATPLPMHTTHPGDPIYERTHPPKAVVRAQRKDDKPTLDADLPRSKTPGPFLLPTSLTNGSRFSAFLASRCACFSA